MKRATSLLQVLLGLLVILVLAVGAIFVIQSIPGLRGSTSPQISDPNQIDPAALTGSAVPRAPEVIADITPGQALSVKFKANDQHIYAYHFTGKAGQKVRISADRKSGSLSFSLYLTNLDETSTVDGYSGGKTDSSSFVVTLPADDTYKVNVTAGDDSGSPTAAGEISLLVEMINSTAN